MCWQMKWKNFVNKKLRLWKIQCNLGSWLFLALDIFKCLIFGKWELANTCKQCKLFSLILSSITASAFEIHVLINDTQTFNEVRRVNKHWEFQIRWAVCALKVKKVCSSQEVTSCWWVIRNYFILCSHPMQVSRISYFL